MTLKGILFDFNGTLFFDSAFHMEAFRRIFPKYGHPVPSDEWMMKNCFGPSNANIYRTTVNPSATDSEIKDFSDTKENTYRTLCLESPHIFHLVDGAVELLDYLKENGIPFCLATGSDIDNVNFYMKHLGIDRWFSEANMVYTNGTFKGKPNPDIYEIAAKKIGLDPSECLVFEDGASGILAANAAKAGALTVVHEATAPSPLSDELKVDGVYHDLKEWKKILADYGLMR